jgi:tight adherence protein B
MTTRLGLSLAGAIAVLAAAVAAPVAIAEDPQLSQLATARFPERAFVLTLPEQRRLGAADMEVLENGEPVASPRLRPADRAGARSFGLVLVIDASISMRGKPIASAMAAARTFAGRRQAEQRLGVITFDEQATTALPMTADQGAIDTALAREPVLGSGTAIRDASLAAVKMLRSEHATGGSVVVLSDGADVYSKAKMETVLDTARRNGVRVFTVGLKSRSYQAATMRELAGGTGATYALASSPRRLGQIFDRLGAALSRQYLLRYRSLAKPKEHVAVEVRLGGGDIVANAKYTTPALVLDSAPPFRRSLGDAFWLSPIAALAVALACALMMGGALLVIVRNRGGGLLERIRHFVPFTPEVDDPEASSSLQGLTPDPRADSGRSRLMRLEGLREDLDVAQMRVSAERLLLAVGCATLLAMWLLATASGTAATAVLGLAVPVGARLLVQFRAGRRRKAFAEQLPDNVQIVASAMRAGHSFIGALSVVVEEAAEPARREFQRIIHDERLGKPVALAFTAAGARMRNEDLDHVGLVARLQTETGGNTSEVLDRLVETLRASAELRRMVRTLTAQGRLGGWVVSAMPLAILVAMTILSPAHAERLFATGAGHLMLVGSAVLIGLGSLVIRRIVDIKV